MAIGAIIAGVASVAGGAIAAGGAKSAASTSAAGAEAGAQVQRDIFDQTQKNVQPWIAAGGNALQRLQDLLGLTAPPGAAPTTPGMPSAPGTPSPGALGAPGQFALPQPGQVQQFANGFTLVGNADGSYAISGPGIGSPINYPAGSDPGTIMTTLGNLGVGVAGSGGPATPVYGTAPPPGAPPPPGGPPTGSGLPYGGFQASPGYQYSLNQALGAVQNRATVSGGLNSGNTLKALQQNAYGLANQDFYNYVGQIANLSTGGQNAGLGLGGIGVNTGNSIGNSLQAVGNANAAGTLGASNAINGAIGQGVQNYFQQSYLNPGGPSGSFGGNYISPTDLSALSTQAQNNFPAGGGGYPV